MQEQILVEENKLLILIKTKSNRSSTEEWKDIIPNQLLIEQKKVGQHDMILDLEF